jgi:hypothetical protein
MARTVFTTVHFEFIPWRSPEKSIPIDAATLQKAQRMIAGCEACSEDAEIPFDNILDSPNGSNPSVTDYVLEVSARCLQCGAEINEKTLVEWNKNA